MFNLIDIDGYLKRKILRGLLYSHREGEAKVKKAERFFFESHKGDYASAWECMYRTFNYDYGNSLRQGVGYYYLIHRKSDKYVLEMLMRAWYNYIESPEGFEAPTRHEDYCYLRSRDLSDFENTPEYAFVDKSLNLGDLIKRYQSAMQIKELLKVKLGKKMDNFLPKDTCKFTTPSREELKMGVGDYSDAFYQIMSKKIILLSMMEVDGGVAFIEEIKQEFPELTGYLREYGSKVRVSLHRKRVFLWAGDFFSSHCFFILVYFIIEQERNLK